MTDRELLELAAKAAGLTIRKWMSTGWLDVGPMNDYWNPLKDDGDALRLAVKLGLVVDCSRPSAGLPFYSHTFSELNADTTADGTRRAIVRAAAEIGNSRGEAKC